MAKATVIASARHRSFRAWNSAPRTIGGSHASPRRGDVQLEIDSRVHFEDADHNAYNILADIPGSDPKAGYVMAGAHLDSWVAGDGAADNGAGSAVVMEAARILASLGVQPKRTIRFALWSGEEEGLLGLGRVCREASGAPAGRRPIRPRRILPPYFSLDTYPVQTLPGFSDLVGYFNIDNGSGKIRGIYTEGNFAVVPIFREWLSPFASLGASCGGCRAHGRDRPCVHEPARACRRSSSSRIRWTTRRGCITPISIPSIICGRRTCGRPRWCWRPCWWTRRIASGPLPRKVLPTPARRDRSIRVSGSGQEVDYSADAGLAIAAYACFTRPRRKSAMISRAALWPGAPVTPPPGCVPDPHMYSPFKGPR